MRLVADANVLIGRLLGSQGRAIVTHPEVELFVAAKVWEEALHELPKRIEGIVRGGRLSRIQAEGLADDAVALVEAMVTLVEADIYLPYKGEATARVPSDPQDSCTDAGCGNLDRGPGLFRLWSSGLDNRNSCGPSRDANIALKSTQCTSRPDVKRDLLSRRLP